MQMMHLLVLTVGSWGSGRSRRTEAATAGITKTRTMSGEHLRVMPLLVDQPPAAPLNKRRTSTPEQESAERVPLPQPAAIFACHGTVSAHPDKSKFSQNRTRTVESCGGMHRS
ncbi:hypothetical protein CALVIDRAFT_323293 [Calocera viscosa TUFC12733]|uniref:Secreted protein n=1 Tax=Calocera viscosa (strain TUFC12733) TaxID=1330018 RepID=A0A167QQN9_CALVF|nr:hypothetical protein CALVIDRAFT_323293 [Calocera viscosa TUFC12733]